MAVTIPVAVPSDATTRVWWVPAIANPAVPKVTELNAAGALDISCYMTGKEFAIEMEQDSGEDERFCSSQVFETPGSIKPKIQDLTYIHNVQTPASTSNKAAATLVQGLGGFIVVRYAMNVETAPAATQIVDVQPVILGAQSKMKPEKNSPAKIQQKVFPTGALVENVALVA